MKKTSNKANANKANATNATNAAPVREVKSCKAWLRELLSKRHDDGKPVRYTMAELVALTGKTEVNVRTMLSDLRSAKYAGKHGVFMTQSVRVDAKTFYEQRID